jgi:hypothetical protein
VDRELRKDEGKNSRGMAMPLRAPKEDRAFSFEPLYLVRVLGTRMFSMVRRMVFRYRPAVMGAAMASRR